MLRHELLVTIPAFLFLGCASARTLDLVEGPRASAPSADARDLPAAGETDPEVSVSSSAALAPEAPPVEPDPALSALPTAPADEAGLRENRFTLKAGYYGATEDELDDGYIIGVSWMRFFTKIFALEFELGYLDIEGSDSGIDADVWALPIMVNGRFNLPVWVLDLYAGLGIGTFYYDAEVSGLGLSEDDDGFLTAGNAFLGGSFNIADRLALGLEAKYYVTDEVDDADAGLDAYALMLTLGFGR